MAQKKTIESIDNGYGNIEVYSPDDILMFYSNRKKLKFYLKHDLIEKINETKYRLKFRPNGLGYAADSAFGDRNCLIKRENRCVVSGDMNIENLSKHHIVPRFFRSNFPPEFKSSFQTIVLIRRDIHSKYTVEEQKFYAVLAEKYNVPNWESFNTKMSPAENKLANSLLHYGHLMPENVRSDKGLQFQHLAHIEPTYENLVEFLKKDVCEEKQAKRIKTIENDFGMAIATKITDYREFEMLWLNHFIEHAKPKYLPEDLIKSYNLEL